MHLVTNRTWIPNERGQNGHTEHTRMILLLKLDWVWTTQKVKGIIIPTKVVVSLTDREKNID